MTRDVNSGAPRLSRIFGTDAWYSAFYRASGQQKLFGGAPEVVKDADFERIAQFWVERLNTIFSREDGDQDRVGHSVEVRGGITVLNRMDGLDLEPRHRLLEGQRRLQVLLR